MEWMLLPAYAYLAALSISLAVIDIRHKRLPNLFTLPAYPILLLLLAIPASMEDRWSDFFRAVLGSGITLLILFLIASVSPSGFGMGDVKLAGALAIPLAWHSWLALLIGVSTAFILSAMYSLVLLAIQRVNRTSLIPFGPFLITSTWLVIVFT